MFSIKSLNLNTFQPIHWTAMAILFALGLLIGGQFSPGLKSDKLPTTYGTGQYDWDVQVVATGLDIPWDLARLPDDSLLITERTGRLKRWDGATAYIVAELPSVQVSESGLTGITLHPKFNDNRYLYLYYTYREGGELKNKVVRYRYENDILTEDRVILDNLGGGQIHNGGRLRFGPDEKLYVLTGDAARPPYGQDRTRLEGKILRLNDDGSVPSDNPIEGSLIYSVGHRNPQGLAWHPLTEELYATEHGESAYDELNKIKPGENYGWGEAKRGELDHQGFTAPILSSNQETWAPSGIDFIGVGMWDLRDVAVFAGLRSKKLQKVEIIDGRVVSMQTIIDGQYGRLRAVLAKGDGSFYVTTSNRDGRADPADDDDKLLLVTPKAKSSN